jgi:CIC family chloride channel protein
MKQSLAPNNKMKSLIYPLIRFYHSLPIRAKMWHRSFLIWRHKHLNNRQFILLLSILMGVSSGLLAVALKKAVHFIQSLLEPDKLNSYENYLYLIYPAIGIIITVLIVKYLIKRRVGHGIPSTLYAISKKNSNLSFSAIYAPILTSMITVGFGGSVGLEGPTVGASSAIGSNYARLGRMNYKTTTLLLGCGAASAMSGIFHAPIAAIVFALEVIMLDLTAGSLIPLLLASVSATLTSTFLLGNEVLFDIELTEIFSFGDLPFYGLLGVFTGLLSVYFCKTYWSIESVFEKFGSQTKKIVVGSSVLGLLLFLFPPLYGEGFGAITSLLNGDEYALLEGSFFYQWKSQLWVLVAFLFATVFLKAVATAVTLGAGGIGGTFAPSLFMGSVFGFSFAKLLNSFGWFNLSEKNFALVGMGGVVAGILHAPLTGLFLIAEITGGYDLVIPLMLTAAISFLTSKYFNPHSLYTMQLAKRGELITHDKDKAVLTLMNLQAEVENDFSTVSPQDSLRILVKTVSKSKRNIFPVVNQSRGLEGIVFLDDIREIMFQPEKYDEIFVNEIMRDFPASISSKDHMDLVMNKFNQSGAWNLPVIDNGKYTGFVSKSKLFNAYRKVLQDFSDE